MNNIVLDIGKEFSKTPDARHRDDGKSSGEQFLNELLGPKYVEAKKAGVKLIVDLDGPEGYGTSFLEESFGGLARMYPEDDILQTLEFHSTRESYLVEDIKKYIEEATER